MQKFIFQFFIATVFLVTIVNADLNPEEIMENDPSIQFLVRVPVVLDEIPETAKFEGEKLDTYYIICHLMSSQNTLISQLGKAVKSQAGGIHKKINFEFRTVPLDKLNDVVKYKCTFNFKIGNKSYGIRDSRIKGVYEIDYQSSAIEGSI